MSPSDKAKIQTFKQSAEVLAEWVLKNIDDCNEARALAYSVLRFKFIPLYADSPDPSTAKEPQ